MRIVYLEDNPQDAELVRRFVSTTGHDIVVTEDTEVFFDAIDASTPLVLIDLLIDDERVGLEVGAALRQRGFGGAMVAVTALSAQADMEACKVAGFDAILNKPFTMSELADVIQQAPTAG